MDKLSNFVHLHCQEEDKTKPQVHKVNFFSRTHEWMGESVQTLIFIILQLLKHQQMALKWSGVTYTHINQAYQDKMHKTSRPN